MCYHNVRDSKGRFTKVDPNIKTMETLKNEFITQLRTDVYWVEYDKCGCSVEATITLMPLYLDGYVSKGGKSKTVADDVLLAYDVNDKKFKAINITTISKFEIEM